jgi:phosphoribosylaminoimidazolecarboxamide formyltransferase / IMP cyclohydrolase
MSFTCNRYTIVSTGGTASAIEKAGIPVTKVEEITNFPEMVKIF